jgi:hypothetical protein
MFDRSDTVLASGEIQSRGEGRTTHQHHLPDFAPTKLQKGKIFLVAPHVARNGITEREPDRFGY